MSPTVKDIKAELAARITACNNIAYGGMANETIKLRMRHRSNTLQTVLSWITGQEQLGCQRGPVTCTNKEHNERKAT